MNVNSEAHTIEPMVQQTIVNIRLWREERERKNREAAEARIATRRKTIATINDRLSRINENLRRLLETSPTFLEKIAFYCQKNGQKTFIELHQIAVSDSVFSANIGLAKLENDNNWAVEIRRQPFQPWRHTEWWPVEETDYDYLVQNFELVLSELENLDTLARIVLEQIT